MTYYLHRKKERPSHMDDWLMTYADMITLLLCFFVVLMSAALIRQGGVVKNEVAQSAVEKPQQQIAAPVINLPFPNVPDQPNEVVSGPIMTEPVQQVADFEPVIIPEMPDAGSAQFEQKGDRITSLEMNSAAFFDSGSAVISANGEKILVDIANKLKDGKFNDYQITVEGHTDDAPINTPMFPSNWELSTARASAVVHFFLGQGIPANKLRAAGYADTFPKLPNRDASGQPIIENQAQNRRVIIKLEKIEKNT